MLILTHITKLLIVYEPHQNSGWVKDRVTTFQYFGLQLCHNTDVYLNTCLPPFPHLKVLVLAVALLGITGDHTFFQQKIQQIELLFFFKLTVNLHLIHFKDNIHQHHLQKETFTACHSYLCF